MSWFTEYAKDGERIRPPEKKSESYRPKNTPQRTVSSKTQDLVRLDSGIFLLPFEAIFENPIHP